METEAIFSLLDKEVFSLAKEQHVVFMWTKSLANWMTKLCSKID